MNPDDLLNELRHMGAEYIEHINGTLGAHLRGTCERLRRWGNAEPICLAGLFHAVYGTYGFAEQLLGIDRRGDIARLIGSGAEQQVYFYAACDRAYFYPRLSRDNRPSFKDRFTDAMFEPDREQVTAFCELTIANELDVAHSGRDAYLAAYGQYVLPLFRSKNFLASLSAKARTECVQCFG